MKDGTLTVWEAEDYLNFLLTEVPPSLGRTSMILNIRDYLLRKIRKKK
jgi:hypothetical protein